MSGIKIFGIQTISMTLTEYFQELKTKVIDDIKAFGAKNAYLDEDDYFVYCVDPAEISANANQVAEAMFPMVEEVPGVKGCKVVDFTTKKELGRYKKK